LSHETSKRSRHFFPEALALLAFLGFLLLTRYLGRLELRISAIVISQIAPS